MLSNRIIEIAGGREVYSQSRSKPGRKTRQIPLPSEVDWIKSPGRIWELLNRYKLKIIFILLKCIILFHYFILQRTRCTKY